MGWRSFCLGLAAGIGGGVGLAAFYRALSLGTMSVVSPVAACGAVVPFAIAIATGERPSRLAVVGAIAALGGAVLASLDERRSESADRARAVALAAVAAVALGLFVYFLGLGSREGDVLSTLVGARVGSLSFLVAACVVRRSSLRLPRASLAAVAAVGLADVSAECALRVRQRTRAALAGLGPRLAVSGRHRAARPHSPRRTPQPRPTSGRAGRAGGRRRDRGRLNQRSSSRKRRTNPEVPAVDGL